MASFAFEGKVSSKSNNLKETNISIQELDKQREQLLIQREVLLDKHVILVCLELANNKTIGVRLQLWDIAG
jgi:hypothetical protein